MPDLGDFADVEIIDVLVKPGDEVAAEQGLVTLETEKASMDVPSPEAGRVLELKVAVGSKVSAGDAAHRAAAERRYERTGRRPCGGAARAGALVSRQSAAAACGARAQRRFAGADVVRRSACRSVGAQARA